MTVPASAVVLSRRSPWLGAIEEWLWQKPSFRMVPDLKLPLAPTGVPVAAPPGALRVGFAGFPSDYSLAMLLGLIDCGVELAGLATSLGANPAISGENALSQIADHMGVPLLRLARINEYDSLVALRRLEADLFMVASFDQILREKALAIPRLGWINVHPSLLPKYRGPEPLYWAIVNDEKETGISFQRVMRGIDAGPLLLQRQEPIRPDDDSGTLARRLSQLGAESTREAVELAQSGAGGSPLDLAQGSYFTSIGHRRIDQSESAALADRMVRAGNPNMLAATQCGGRLCYVVKVRRIPASDPSPGPRLHFPDGDLLLEQTVDRCGCHHGQPVGTCPHDE
ncbi:MAG TPA: methionyl-tRNA formyltransferase [Candidatus Dormibacteraeota bacterium]|nr:methionyl-tRNA formyltransferase [Candidatus Dormibacteraeota bacterium]